MNTQFMFQIHGGSDHDGGLLENIEKWLAYLGEVADKSPTEIFSQLLPGLAAMVNIHPLLVHFPIAFFLTFFVLDFLGSCFKSQHWRKSASWFLHLGTISAVFAVVSGFFAAKSVAVGEAVREIMETHAHLGMSTLVLAVMLSLWRMKMVSLVKGGVNAVFLFMSALLCVLLILNADLGGLLVYKYGVAVKVTAP
jgi:uncharacterized membrane protein